MPTALHRKPPMAAWIVRERNRLGLKPRDLAERLNAQGLAVQESTIKVWEANGDRRPSPLNLEGLERVFGVSAPDLGGGGGSDALVSALTAQTEAITALVEEMRQARERDQDAASAMVRAAEVLLSGQPRSGDGASTEPPVLHGSDR